MQFVPCAGRIQDTGTPKGRGVFATRALYKGDIVEICPVLPIACSYAELPADLRTTLFSWRVLAGAEGVFGLALGYGSLYNHDNPANLRYAASGNGEGLVFIADRHIAAGEELTINYNASAGATRSTEDNWFIDNQVVPYMPPLP